MVDRVKWVGSGIGRALLDAVRYSVYVVLLMVGRVLVPVASVMVVGGLILFLFCLLFLRDQTRWMVVGAVLAGTGICFQVFFQAALRLVAPEGTVIVSEL